MASRPSFDYFEIWISLLGGCFFSFSFFLTLRMDWELVGIDGGVLGGYRLDSNSIAIFLVLLFLLAVVVVVVVLGWPYIHTYVSSTSDISKGIHRHKICLLVLLLKA